MNLKFWKKEDDLALPDMASFGKSELGLKDNTGLDLSSHFEPNNQFMPAQAAQPQAPMFPPQPTFQQSYPPPQSPSYPPGTPVAVPVEEDHAQQHIEKDLEVIAAKLDTIRAQLEMLNARIANLEHNQGPPKRPWY